MSYTEIYPSCGIAPLDKFGLFSVPAPPRCFASGGVFLMSLSFENDKIGQRIPELLPPITPADANILYEFPEPCLNDGTSSLPAKFKG